MYTKFHRAIFCMAVFLLSACQKELESNSQSRDNALSRLGAERSAIIHQLVNDTITLLPLPSRSGDVLSKTLTQYYDLNGDHQKDFAFTLQWSRWDRPYQKNDAATPTIYGAAAGDSLVTDYLYYTDYFGGKLADFVRAVPGGDKIKTLTPFTTGALLASYYHAYPYYYSGGEFRGEGNQLVGVKFTAKNGTLHYGWICIKLSADANTLIVKDFAYNNKANAYIIAGAY